MKNDLNSCQHHLAFSVMPVLLMLGLLFSLPPSSALGQTTYTSQIGAAGCPNDGGGFGEPARLANWSNSDCWDSTGSGIPDGSSDIAVIENGDFILLDGGLTSSPLTLGGLKINDGGVEPVAAVNLDVQGDVTIEASGTLKLAVSGGAIDLDLEGDLQNNGQFTGKNGSDVSTVTFTSGGAQEISGNEGGTSDAFIFGTIDLSNSQVTNTNGVFRITGNLTSSTGGSLDFNKPAGAPDRVVTIQSGDPQTIDGDGSYSFDDVFLRNSSTAGVTFSQDVSIQTILRGDDGEVTLDSGVELEIAGDLAPPENISGGTITFNGGTEQLLDAVDITLPDIEIIDDVGDGSGAASTVQLGNNSGTLTLGSLTIKGGSELTAEYKDGSGTDINSPTNLTIPGNVDVTDGTLELAGGTVDPDYLIAGDLAATADGTFISNGRSLTFNGGSSGTQEISGDVSVRNITVINSSDVDVTSGNLEITGDLDLQSGSFDTGGFLTIASDRISADGSLDGAIIGNGTLTSAAGDRVERFISEAANGGIGGSSVDDVAQASNDEIGDDAGFRLLAHPFASTTPAKDLKRTSNGTNFTFGGGSDPDDDSIVDPLPAAGGSPGNTGNSMIFRFDSGNQSFESEDASTSSNTDRDFEMEQGRGYLVFFFDDTEDPINNDGNTGPTETTGLVFDAGGTQPLTSLSSANDPSVTLADPTSSTSFGNPDNESAFHLVGNPYPSGYDVGEMMIDGNSIADINSRANDGVPNNDPKFSSTLQRVIILDGSNNVETFGPGGTESNFASSWQGFYIEQTASTGGDITVSFPSTGVVGGSDNDEIFFGARPAAQSSSGFNLRLRKRANPGASLPAFSTQDNAEIVFREDANTGRDVYDSGKLVLPTVATARSGNPMGLETALLALGGGNGSAFFKRDARPLPASSDYPITFDVTFDCANLDEDATYAIDITEANNLHEDWGVLLKDNEGSEAQLYTGGTSGESYTFSVPASACSSTTGTNSNATSSLDYDGSLTGPGVSTNATTGSRFQLLVGPTETLPVEFNELKGAADGQDVVLEWSTVSETNNAGFQVQQQRDGAFVDLESAFVEGAGTTDQPKSYRFRVEDVSPGTHTFRLKQVDVDGTSTVTDPLDVKVGLAGQFQLAAYPNPFQGRATVEFAVKDAQPVTIELYNTLGQRVRTVYQGTARAEETLRETIDGRGLSSGLYIVRLKGDGFTATRKITLVR